MTRNYYNTDDIEQWSCVEEVQQQYEYFALWNVEQQIADVVDCSPPCNTCSVRPLRNDQIQSSAAPPMPTAICKRWSGFRWSHSWRECCEVLRNCLLNSQNQYQWKFSGSWKNTTRLTRTPLIKIATVDSWCLHWLAVLQMTSLVSSELFDCIHLEKTRRYWYWWSSLLVSYLSTSNYLSWVRCACLIVHVCGIWYRIISAET